MTTISGTARTLRGGIVAGLFLVTTGAPASPVPEFERDIAPILERRCRACHNEEKREGQLGLHARAAIEKGGESGRKLINVPYEENELWRRVAGTDVELRMPAEGPPLDGTELATIERWARAGAPWPKEASPGAPRVDESPWLLWLVGAVPAWLDPFLERLDRWRAGYGSVMYLALALVGWIALAEHWKRRPGKASRLTVLLRASATRTSYGWLAVAVAAWGVWVHVAALRAREAELQNRIAVLEKEARQFAEPPRSFLVDLEPEKPKHPPRLGGTYYRGNDERSPSLFNGGFYRTATMHLTLCDGSGHHLAWGDTFPSGDVFVCLGIERAPMAAPMLFRPAIMAKAFLSPCRPSEPTPALASLVYPLETLEEGERWVGRMPLEVPPPDPAGDRLLEGKLYLYNCVPKKERIVERPHFGIRYRIVVKAGVIQPGSELWMGSLYRLSQIFYPPQDKIIPSEWFDSREIPVIEGGNSSDPGLLGVEEHQHKLK